MNSNMSSFLTSTPNRSLVAEAADRSLTVSRELRKAEKTKPWIAVNLSIVAIIAIDLALNNFLLNLLAPRQLALEAWIVVEKTVFLILCCNVLFLIVLAIRPIFFSSYAHSFGLTNRQIKLLGIPANQMSIFLKKPVSAPVCHNRISSSFIQAKDSSLESSLPSLDLSWLFRSRPKRSTDVINESLASSWCFQESPIKGTKNVSVIPYGEGDAEYCEAEALSRARRARSRSPFIAGDEASQRCLTSQKTLHAMLSATKMKKQESASFLGTSLDEDNSPADRQRQMFSVRSQNHSFFDQSSPSFAHYADSSFNSPSYGSPSTSNSLIDSNFGVASREASFASNSSSLNGSFAAPKKLDFSLLMGQKYKTAPVLKVDDSMTSPTENSDGSLVGAAAGPAVSLTERSIWLKYDVDPDQLDLLTHNCRVWISRTIFQPLIREAENLSVKISEISNNFSFGSASLSVARQVAQNFGSQFPSLNALLPYLELTNDQTFLWSRFKALSDGSCLSAYDPYRNRSNRTDSAIYGSAAFTYRPQPSTPLTEQHDFDSITKSVTFKASDASFGQHRNTGFGNKFFSDVSSMKIGPKPGTMDTALTDFDIVLHCLRIYLTGRLAPNPVRMNSFDSSKYFSLYPRELPANLSGKNLLIRRPGPEQKVVLIYGNHSLDIGGKGISNLFRVLVMFLQILKQDFDSKLGQLSLGPSGLNVLWIFDNELH